MRTRSAALTAVAAAALLAPAGASAQTVDPAKHSKVVKQLRTGDRTPVAFPRGTETARGRAVALRKGAKLRRGQVVQVGRMTGPLVFPPRDCPCQGYALRVPAGKRLVNVVVRAVRKGRVIATSDAARTLVEGDRPSNLGYAYAFDPDTRSFPRGTKLKVYGLFVNA